MFTVLWQHVKRWSWCD